VTKQPYALFVDYLPLTGEIRRLMPPILIEALNEEEASRIASGIADFAFPEVCRGLLIRITGPVEEGRVIGEIRRPKSEN